MGGHRASGAGDDLVDGPVDIAAVRADDALLDAIAGGAPSAARPGAHGAGYGFADGLDAADDDRIAAILTAWRADIEADPMPELVTLDEAVEAITAGQEAQRRVAHRHRRRMPFAVAAAAAVVAFAGLTVAAHGAAPGDTLFGVSKVFFSEHAAQQQKVADVRQHIDDANAAISRHDYVAARQALGQVDTDLPAVPPQQQAPLSAERDRAASSLGPETPAATAPGARPAAPPPGPSSSSSRRTPAPGGPGAAGSPGSQAASPDGRPSSTGGHPTDGTPSPQPTTQASPTDPSQAGRGANSPAAPTTTTTAPRPSAVAPSRPTTN